MRLLHLQQHVDQLRITDWHRFALPQQLLEPALVLPSRPALLLQACKDGVAVLHQSVPVLRRNVRDHGIDVVCLVPAKLVGGITNLRPNLVRKRNGEGLRTTGRRGSREGVEQAARDAQLHERVVELVALPEEAAVQDEGVRRDLREVLRGEAGLRVEGLAVGEELRRPVDRTAHPAGRVLAVGVGLLVCLGGGGVLEGLGVVGELEGELVHFLGMRPCTLGLEQEQLKAAAL